MINRVVLVGRMTRDPELRKTNNCTSVVSFTLALDNRTKGPNGEKTTSFIPCQAWNQQAENCARYTRKGSLVGIEGRISQRSFDTKDGRRASVVEVICDSVQFLEKKSDANTSSQDMGYASDEQPSYIESAPESNNVSSIDVADDDLPF